MSVQVGDIFIYVDPIFGGEPYIGMVLSKVSEGWRARLAQDGNMLPQKYYMREKGLVVIGNSRELGLYMWDADDVE